MMPGLSKKALKKSYSVWGTEREGGERRTCGNKKKMKGGGKGGKE